MLSTGGSKVHVWELATGRPVRPAYRGHRRDVTAMAVTAVGDGRAVVASSDDGGTVHVWDLTRRRPLGPPFTDNSGLVGRGRGRGDGWTHARCLRRDRRHHPDP
ncbi:hypothetical protein ACN27F_06015 [Solwaraspora sp. WMMB335]|uniref:hypothetical protein n=1 Tax=Solwaraspora sp. WMMB335 TaxID=3404118 RepID=UPI003B9258F3